MNKRAAPFPASPGSGRRDAALLHTPEGDFRALAENIPDVIARLDRALRIRYVNRAARESFGDEPSDLIGRTCAEVLSPSAWLAPLSSAAAAAFQDGTEQAFHFIATVHGQSRQYVGRVVPEKSADGDFDAVLGIAYDVTAQADEAQRRDDQLASERHARVDAESATLGRDQFLAIVSHELRSPLNGIKSWTHVLQNQLPDPEPTVRRALAGIMIGVEHQVQLIEDLLDVTRAMGGQLGLVKLPVLLGPIVEQAVDALQPAAADKGVVIERDVILAESEIHGDRDRLCQVFINLLANAVKFTPRDGTVRVSARADDTMARVEVRDNGAGIPQDFLPYVFDPFRQADTGSRRGQDGLGLGLALAHRLAELHGGYVSCESEGAGRGATFRVYLPLRRDMAPRPRTQPPRAKQAATPVPMLHGVHILVIDDQREARESLSTLLSQAGAIVVAAGSGQEALAHLALADGDGREIILCDIAMPGEDGYATLRRIRAWESTRGRGMARRPAVALSAFTQREDSARALAEGFDLHLAKPVVPAQLLQAIAGIARA